MIRFAALPVEVISAHHDALEKIGAFGGLAGGLAGITALIFAARSAGDASRSATASERSATAAETSAELAEQSLTILREEAEANREIRSRKAEPVISLFLDPAVGTTEDTPPVFVVLVLAFRNKGNKVAERVWINFLVPDSIPRMETVDQAENNTYEGSIAHTSERVGEHEGAIYWVSDVGPLEAGGSLNVLHRLRLHRPPPGDRIVKGLLINEDLPGRERERYWLLRVPAAGRDVELISVGDDSGDG